MPKQKLNMSQMITMGAKALPIFDVPSGWMRKRQIKMAQVEPTMVDEVMSGLTISRLRVLVSCLRIASQVGIRETTYP